MASKDNSDSQLFLSVIVLLLAVMAFLLGGLFQKVQDLEQNRSVKAAEATAGDITPPPSAPAGKVEPISAQDHIRGDRNAPVALIEYADMECPYCQQFHATAQQIVAEYKGQVMWVYRHFPLSFHSAAMPRALGSECAAKLAGSFWGFVDQVFSAPNFSGTPEEIAAKLKINKNEFENCLKDDSIRAKVDEDLNLGRKAGITGTPGNILLNTISGESRFIPGALPFDQIKPTIDLLLSR